MHPISTWAKPHAYLAASPLVSSACASSPNSKPLSLGSIFWPFSPLSHWWGIPFTHSSHTHTHTHTHPPTHPHTHTPTHPTSLQACALSLQLFTTDRPPPLFFLSPFPPPTPIFVRPGASSFLSLFLFYQMHPASHSFVHSFIHLISFPFTSQPRLACRVVICLVSL